MSDAISVECPKCHAKLKLKNRSAVGKRVPCPRCKQPFVVAAPPEEDELDFMNVDEPEPDEFGEPAGESDDDELPEPPSRQAPSRHGKKKSKGASANLQKPIMIGVGALALVAVLVGGGFFAFQLAGGLFGSRNKIDLAYLPPDADLIVHVRLAEVWKAPLLQSFLTGPAIKSQLEQLQKELGIDPASITSVTLGQTGAVKGISGKTPGAKSPDPVVVIRATTAFDVEKLTKGNQRTEEVSHQGQIFHRRLQRGAAPWSSAFFLPKPDTLVMGTESDISAAIERGKATARRADIDFIDSTRQVLVLFAPRDSSDFDSSGPSPAGTPPAMARLTEVTRGKLKGVCLGFSIGEAVDWNLATNCTSTEAAAAISAEIEKSLQEARTQFAQLKPAIPPQMADLVQLGDSVLGSIRLNPKAAVVEVAGQIPSSIKSAAEMLPAMLMGGMLPIPGAGGPAPTMPQFPGAASNGQFPGGTFPGGDPVGQFPQGAFPPEAVPVNTNPPAGGTPPR